MYASGLRSDEAAGFAASALPADALLPIRARGRLQVEAVVRDGQTWRGDVYESGALRVRFPREHMQRLDATVVNVAGGMTGGDAFDMEFVAREGASLFISSAAAEKIYRSSGAPADVAARLRAESGAQCIWLPQETIVFNNAHLVRRLDADIADDARFLACEMTIVGRAAMHEVVDSLQWRERWRIRRGGKLVLAEDSRLEGDAAARLVRRAVGDGAHCFATLAYVAGDAEAVCASMRVALERESDCEAGVSCFEGLTVARFAAKDGAAMRAAVMRCVAATGHFGLPRGWHT